MADKKGANPRHSAGRIPQALLERHCERYPDFGPEAAQLVFSVRALATSINDASKEWLSPNGLNPVRMNVIAILEGIPQGLPLSTLGALLHTRGPHVTALIDLMEDDGLVRRYKNPSDRRSFIVRLTPTGRRLFHKSFPTHYRANNRFVSCLSPSERRHLLELLAKLYSNVVQFSGAAHPKGTYAL